MERPELYHKSVDILFQAYFNDTLQHRNCCACAVGNLVAGNNGYTFITRFNPYRGEDQKVWVERITPNGTNGWASVFCTDTFEQRMYMDEYKGEAKRQIDSTGYTVDELAQIEFAFECASIGESDEEWMFNGLVEVLDVLKRIHKVKDNSEDVSRFRNHYQQKQLA